MLLFQTPCDQYEWLYDEVEVRQSVWLPPRTFLAINVNDGVTKSKLDKVYGCRHSLPNGIMHASGVMFGGQWALI